MDVPKKENALQSNLQNTTKKHWQRKTGKQQKLRRYANRIVQREKIIMNWLLFLVQTNAEVLQKKYSWLDLFRTKIFALITLNCMYSW